MWPRRTIFLHGDKHASDVTREQFRIEIFFGLAAALRYVKYVDQVNSFKSSCCACLSAAKKTLNVLGLQLYVCRPAMIALTGMRRYLHLA